MSALRIVFLILASTLLMACGEDSSTEVDPSPEVDAGVVSDMNTAVDAEFRDADDIADAEPVLDASDAGAEPADRPSYVVASLQDGTFARGEIVAVYDRTRWWNPASGGLVYALFDPERFAFGDTDRSFTFVAADDVAGLEAMEPVTQSYREFLRERGFEFDRNPLDVPAYVVMGNDGYHLDEDGYGDFAFDLQITDDQGRRFTGTGAQGQDHLVWDAPAYAPIGGTVFEIVESGVDQTPGAYEEGAVNNLVGITLGGNFYAYLLHFRQDGVDGAISVGDRVETGDYLGRVGNSGVTLEPHLHVVLLWYDPVAGRSYSVPAAFSEIEVAPGPLGPWDSTTSAIPETGVWIR